MTKADMLVLAEELEHIARRERQIHPIMSLGEADCETLERAAAALRATKDREAGR